MKFVLAVLALALSFSSFSQNTIKGKVVDEKGPMMSVTVFIKGTTIGKFTDMDGNFELKHELTDEKITLKVSFTGYIAEDIVIDNSEQVDVGTIMIYNTKSKKGKAIKKAQKKAKK